MVLLPGASRTRGENTVSHTLDKQRHFSLLNAEIWTRQAGRQKKANDQSTRTMWNVFVLMKICAARSPHLAKTLEHSTNLRVGRSMVLQM